MMFPNDVFGGFTLRPPQAVLQLLAAPRKNYSPLVLFLNPSGKKREEKSFYIVILK
jgi:hypothetical protein